MKRNYLLFVILILSVGALMGCTTPVQVVVQPTQPLLATPAPVVPVVQPTSGPDLQSTISALQTQIASIPQVVNSPIPSLAFTSTPLPATAVPGPTATQTPAPLQNNYGVPVVNVTPLAPLYNPQTYYYPQGSPYYYQSYPYNNAYAPCNRAGFIADITIRDGTNLPAGTGFAKTWRLRNDGSCTWTPDYSLVFDHGSHLGGQSSIKLPGSVAPGGIIDLSVNLTAPTANGLYQDYWMLQDPNGSRFGVGVNATTPIWVRIWVGYTNYYYPQSYYYPNSYSYPQRNYYPNYYPGVSNYRYTNPAKRPGYDPNGYWGHQP